MSQSAPTSSLLHSAHILLIASPHWCTVAVGIARSYHRPREISSWHSPFVPPLVARVADLPTTDVVSNPSVREVLIALGALKVLSGGGQGVHFQPSFSCLARPDRSYCEPFLEYLWQEVRPSLPLCQGAGATLLYQFRVF